MTSPREPHRVQFGCPAVKRRRGRFRPRDLDRTTGPLSSSAMLRLTPQNITDIAADENQFFTDFSGGEVGSGTWAVGPLRSTMGVNMAIGKESGRFGVAQLDLSSVQRPTWDGLGAKFGVGIWPVVGWLKCETPGGRWEPCWPGTIGVEIMTCVDRVEQYSSTYRNH